MVKEYYNVYIPELNIPEEPNVLFTFPTGDVRVSADNSGCWHEHNNWSKKGSNLGTKNSDIKVRKEWFGGIILVNGNMIAINESGLCAIQLRQSGKTIGEICDTLSEKYRFDKHGSKECIEGFFTKIQWFN